MVVFVCKLLFRMKSTDITRTNAKRTLVSNSKKERARCKNIRFSLSFFFFAVSNYCWSEFLDLVQIYHFSPLSLPINLFSYSFFSWWQHSLTVKNISRLTFLCYFCACCCCCWAVSCFRRVNTQRFSTFKWQFLKYFVQFLSLELVYHKFILNLQFSQSLLSRQSIGFTL